MFLSIYNSKELVRDFIQRYPITKTYFESRIISIDNKHVGMLNSIILLNDDEVKNIELFFENNKVLKTSFKYFNKRYYVFTLKTVTFDNTYYIVLLNNTVLRKLQSTLIFNKVTFKYKEFKETLNDEEKTIVNKRFKNKSYNYLDLLLNDLESELQIIDKRHNEERILNDLKHVLNSFNIEFFNLNDLESELKNIIDNTFNSVKKSNKVFDLIFTYIKSINDLIDLEKNNVTEKTTINDYILFDNKHKGINKKSRKQYNIIDGTRNNSKQRIKYYKDEFLKEERDEFKKFNSKVNAICYHIFNKSLLKLDNKERIILTNLFKNRKTIIDYFNMSIYFNYYFNQLVELKESEESLKIQKDNFLKGIKDNNLTIKESLEFKKAIDLI